MEATSSAWRPAEPCFAHTSRPSPPAVPAVPSWHAGHDLQRWDDRPPGFDASSVSKLAQTRWPSVSRASLLLSAECSCPWGDSLSGGGLQSLLQPAAHPENSQFHGIPFHHGPPTLPHWPDLAGLAGLAGPPSFLLQALQPSRPLGVPGVEVYPLASRWPGVTVNGSCGLR